MTKKRFHTSLQLKLTLLLSLLMIISCVLMYFFISHSAVSGMDGLQNYMIKVDPQDGDSPITFNVDPKALFPQFEQEIQETKEDFLLRSVIATTIIILLSSVCTYFLTKKTLMSCGHHLQSCRPTWKFLRKSRNRKWLNTDSFSL